VTHALPLTGERTLPGVPGEEYWFARHEAAYRWVAAEHGHRIRGAVVLEAGSGEGYGAELLRSAGARAVIALEYDDSTVTHASATYRDVHHVRCNLAALPLRTGMGDVLVSLQVVEHLWGLRAFLLDCARVLRPGGLVVVTTPNRVVFSPGLARGAAPTNPFHVEEFDSAQLSSLLGAAGFVEVELLGLHHGPRITKWENDNRVGIVAAQVAAVLHGADAPPSLPALVTTVTADDFVVGPAEGCQDLVVAAVCP
jgi:SAM-dependent methyltransferase